VIITRHVDRVEKNVNLIGFKDDDGEYDYQDEDRDRNEGNDTVGS